jgi:hypothetical protein
MVLAEFLALVLSSDSVVIKKPTPRGGHPYDGPFPPLTWNELATALVVWGPASLYLLSKTRNNATWTSRGKLVLASHPVTIGFH